MAASEDRGVLVFEVYTVESVSLFASSTTFPTDLTENI